MQRNRLLVSCAALIIISHVVSAQQIRTTNERTFKILVRTLRAGNEALSRKSYDEAIKNFDEGISADPTQVSLWVNKLTAHRMRGALAYNEGLIAKDNAVRMMKLEFARVELRTAVEAAKKAVDVLKDKPYPNLQEGRRFFEADRLTVMSAYNEALWLFVSKVEPSQLDAAVSALRGYLDAEADPGKRRQAQLRAAQTYLDINAPLKAIEEYQRILNTSPTDVDALLGISLALYKSSDPNNYDKALTFLNSFVVHAPDAHAMKRVAAETVSLLHSQSNEVDSLLREGKSNNVRSADVVGVQRDIAFSGVLNGKALQLPQPTYPLLAKTARIAGGVVIRIVIDEEGKVAAAQASSGHPLLVAAAAVVRGARFAPTLVEGKPIKVIGEIRYNFTLKEQR